VKHVTGIPNSPTGQAIIERAHQTLKYYLAKHAGITDPQERFSKVLFVLNFLCLTGDHQEPPIVLHHATLKNRAITSILGLLMKYRNPKTGNWEGP
ncbi:IGEB protein, partial [Tricholaema leucomelas]|nr:IGEB protein [Tricholaema leucomelas]